MELKLQEKITKIIKPIPQKIMFDSHYVIDTLIKNYSDDYFAFIRRNPGKARDVHNKIAKIIGRCGARKVGDSFSYTIHWKVGKCALWEKIK